MTKGIFFGVPTLYGHTNPTLPVVRELVREDIDALLFAPDDAGDLARQITRVLNDRELAETLAANAAARARAKLTWHAAQKKLLKVYERLLRRGA